MSDTQTRSRRAHAGPRRPADPGPPQPSHAERARTLLHLGRLGTLASHSRHAEGWPFGSITPYALDPAGHPLLLISGMAMHTQNLRADERASLLVSEPSEGRDPLGLGRVTVLARAAPVADDELDTVRPIYLEAHPNASYWVDFGDFAFYRLKVEQLYFVGGFGVMGWVEGADYLAAAPDPLAEAASHILEHMNTDHADAQRLLAEAALGEPVEEATMTAVDRLGFHLRLRLADRPRGLRLDFPEPVENAEEARQQLVAMVRAARASRSDRPA